MLSQAVRRTSLCVASAFLMFAHQSARAEGGSCSILFATPQAAQMPSNRLQRYRHSLFAIFASIQKSFRGSSNAVPDDRVRYEFPLESALRWIENESAATNTQAAINMDSHSLQAVTRDIQRYVDSQQNSNFQVNRNFRVGLKAGTTFDQFMSELSRMPKLLSNPVHFYGIRVLYDQINDQVDHVPVTNLRPDLLPLDPVTDTQLISVYRHNAILNNTKWAAILRFEYLYLNYLFQLLGGSGGMSTAGMETLWLARSLAHSFDERLVAAGGSGHSDRADRIALYQKIEREMENPWLSIDDLVPRRRNHKPYQ